MKYLRLALLISIVISVGIFLYSTDFQEVYSTLKTIGWRAGLILISTFSAYILASLGWKYCLGDDFHKVSLTRLLVYRQIGETLSLFNPTSIIAGEWLKSAALKKHGISQVNALSSVLLARILMIVGHISLLILSLVWLLLVSSVELFPNYKLWLGGVLMLLVLVIFGLLVILLQKPKDSAESSGKVMKYVKEYKMALNSYVRRYPKYAFLAFFFLLLHWVAGSLEMYFILKFLGYNVTVFHGVLMDMGVVLIKSVGAFIPGQLGIEELGNKLVILMIGISSASLWVTVSIIKRSRQLFWSAVGGVLYLFYRKRLF